MRIDEDEEKTAGEGDVRAAAGTGASTAAVKELALPKAASEGLRDGSPEGCRCICCPVFS